MNPVRPVLAASLACFRDGKALIARRARTPSKGLWTLPGGRVEPGETAGVAALRELFEETGAEARLAGFAGHVEAIARAEDGRLESHVVILAFAGLWIAGEPRPGEELDAVAWVAPDALGAYETTEGLAAILLRAAEIARRAAAPEGSD